MTRLGKKSIHFLSLSECPLSNIKVNQTTNKVKNFHINTSGKISVHFLWVHALVSLISDDENIFHFSILKRDSHGQGSCAYYY